jgi:hypothetical protein
LIEQQVFSDPDRLSLALRYQYLTLRQGLRLETEWLTWCEEAIATVSQLSQPMQKVL